MAKRAPRSDFDTAWKELLQRYFEAAMEFFFPQLHDEIDWTRGFSFRDKELQYAVRQAGRGKRTVDLLAEVRLRQGDRVWIFLHVEVQNQVDPGFGQRMFVCNTMLFARHRREVLSAAILGDTRRDWRPDRFRYGRAGFEAEVRFPVAKLLDYESRWGELERSQNPFAAVVMAHLKTQETRAGSETRLQWKKRVMRWLAEQGRPVDELADLFRFIDLVMTLTPNLESQFQEFVSDLEEEQKMPFLSSYERKAMTRGRQEGRQEGRQQGRHEGTLEATRNAVMDALEARFSLPPLPLRERLLRLDDPSLLMALHRAAVTVGSLDEFEKQLPRTRQAA